MTRSIVLGGGCFWCLDAAYRMVKGVESSIVGFSGGSIKNPTYGQVITGSSGHAEVTKVTYDESVISLEEILDIFWLLHDPTTLNRQGYDVGTEYRSCIFFEDSSDEATIESSVRRIQKLFPDPVTTEVSKLTDFYPAEEYHQDYFQKNPEAGYCQVVINPKLVKLRAKAAQLLA